MVASEFDPSAIRVQLAAREGVMPRERSVPSVSSGQGAAEVPIPTPARKITPYAGVGGNESVIERRKCQTNVELCGSSRPTRETQSELSENTISG
jgi:hypothetical protein